MFYYVVMKLKLIDISRGGNIAPRIEKTEFSLVSVFTDKPLVNLEIYREILTKQNTAQAPRLTNRIF